MAPCRESSSWRGQISACVEKVVRVERLHDRTDSSVSKKMQPSLLGYFTAWNRNAEPADKSVLINVRIKRPHLSPGAMQ
jgi:hypothetical protein